MVGLKDGWRDRTCKDCFFWHRCSPFHPSSPEPSCGQCDSDAYETDYWSPVWTDEKHCCKDFRERGEQE